MTVAMVPATANDTANSFTGATDPLAVIVLLTTPCCTVVVSFIAALPDAARGSIRKRAAMIAATMTTANETLITTGLRMVMTKNCASTL